MAIEVFKMRPFEMFESEQDVSGILWANVPYTIHGMDSLITVDDDVNYPFRALEQAGLPTMNAPLPRDPNCIVISRRFRGISNGTIVMMVKYQRSFPTSMPLETWIPQDNTGSMTVPSQILLNPNSSPPVRDPIRVRSVIAIGGKIPQPVILEKTGTIRLKRQLNQLVLVGVWPGFGRRASWRRAVDSVNEKPWLGLPAGFWRVEDVSNEAVQVNVGDIEQSYYRWRIVFQTQIWMPWWEFLFLRLPDGNYGKVKDEDMKELLTEPYSPVRQIKRDSVTRVDPYPWIDFENTFLYPKAINPFAIT